LWPDGFHRDGGDGLGCFDGIGGGKFPVAMGLGARGTGMEFTHFPDGSATRSARHRGYLFGGEFSGFHHHIMQRFRAGRCSILHILNICGGARFPFGCTYGFLQL
jgi:hypothetical protein